MKPERRIKQSNKRLERLLCSGLVQSKDLEEYAAELRKTANNLASADALEHQSNLFKALSDEARLKILQLLSQREMCVCELTVALDLAQPTASHHLNILKAANLINDRKEGKWTFYSISKPNVVQRLFSFLDELS
jgi:DNA-binding transcriptional ArsR family regulator